MKTCPFCSKGYADAQETCPHCGRKPGDPRGELGRVQDVALDEGFGPGRRRQLLHLIIILLILTLVALVSWFW